LVKPKNLGIYEVIQQLKKEFEELEKPTASKYRFDIKEVEIELSVAVKRKGKAGINVWIVEVGGEYSSEEIHKIKLKLEPYVDLEEEEKQKETSRTPAGYKKWKEVGGYDEPGDYKPLPKTKKKKHHKGRRLVITKRTRHVKARRRRHVKARRRR